MQNSFTNPEPRPDPDAQIFAISVAAELAGMHAQTLRTYDRLGLVSPERTSGGGRRYSQHDVDLLREVQRLSQNEGVNLAGIKRIIVPERNKADLDEVPAEVKNDLEFVFASKMEQVLAAALEEMPTPKAPEPAVVTPPATN